jgi:hypothetical protein
MHWLRERRRGQRLVPTDLEAFDKATGGPVAIGGAS